MVGVLCALGAGVPAQAHNALAGSDPANGSRVDRVPATVTLRFLAALDRRVTTVAVAGPDGAPRTKGLAVVKGRTVTVGVQSGGPGRYTVTYRTESADGHDIKGTVGFTVTGAGSPAPGVARSAEVTGSPTSAPGTASTAATPDGGATVTATAVRAPTAGAPDGTPVWPWLLGAALLAAAGAGAYLRRRRRTS